jgi:hypothetical protein
MSSVKFYVDDPELRRVILNPADTFAFGEYVKLHNVVNKTDLNKYLKDIRNLYLIISYLHFLVTKNTFFIPKYQALFHKHKTDSKILKKLQGVAESIKQNGKINSDIETLFDQANEERMPNERAPILAKFIKIYQENRDHLNRVSNITLLDKLINDVKRSGVLYLTKLGRSIPGSFVHPPPPTGSPPEDIKSSFKPLAGKRKTQKQKQRKKGKTYKRKYKK